MERALLVVADDAEARELGEQAGEFAAGVGAELHVVRFVDQREYQERLQQAATGSREIESIHEARTFAHELAQAYADNIFEELDVDVHIEGVVDEMPQAVVEHAVENDCDHIFIRGTKRSPTGKALFGDTVQSVILNFDGLVTVHVA